LTRGDPKNSAVAPTGATAARVDDGLMTRPGIFGVTVQIWNSGLTVRTKDLRTKPRSAHQQHQERRRRREQAVIARSPVVARPAAKTAAWDSTGKSDVQHP